MARTVGGSVASAWRVGARRLRLRGQGPLRLGNEVVEKFGPEARARLEQIGFKFNAGQPE